MCVCGHRISVLITVLWEDITVGVHLENTNIEYYISFETLLSPPNLLLQLLIRHPAAAAGAVAGDVAVEQGQGGQGRVCNGSNKKHH